MLSQPRKASHVPCTFCGAEIWWSLSKNNKWYPCNSSHPANFHSYTCTREVKVYTTPENELILQIEELEMALASVDDVKMFMIDVIVYMTFFVAIAMLAAKFAQELIK